MKEDNRLIVALAGRRIDAQDEQQSRFPLTSVKNVKSKLAIYFKAHSVAALVCSGACGADLLALEVAQEQHIYCRLILPFEPPLFRLKSVVDRPGEWGARFDKVLQHLQSHPASGQLVCLHFSEQDAQAYKKANHAILAEAQLLSQQLGFFVKATEPITTVALGALIVWDGRAKSHGDATEHFKSAAMLLGFKVDQLLTT
jgi:hypothetical protein